MGKVRNFQLENCYVDTSYQSMNGQIFTSKFSETTPQTQPIGSYFIVVANDGYKLSPEFSFDFQFKETYKDGYWESITHESFKPIDKELSLKLDFQRGDVQLQGVDISQSYYTDFTSYNSNTGNYDRIYLFLLGGFKDNRLIFHSTITNYNGQWGQYGSYKLVKKEFNYRGYDSNTGNYGDKISLLDNLNFKAISDGPTYPDVTQNLFETYYLTSSDLEKIKTGGKIPTDIIINTFSYPIVFPDDDLIDVTMKVSYMDSDIEVKGFRKNETKLEIFSFDVPEVPNVRECYIRIPFNSNISLDYEDIRGKTIKGFLTYEVLTNTTTLFINDEEKTLYKNVVTIGIKTPYKPTGEFKNFDDTTVRLAYEEPKLFIRGMFESVKGNYLKGVIKEPLKNILKDELVILNSLVNEGVFLND